MSTLRCPNCSGELGNRSSETFCWYCGFDLDDGENSEALQAQNNVTTTVSHPEPARWNRILPRVIVSVLIAAIALPALTLLGELWFMPVLFGTLFLWSFAPALRSD